jgi:hypothetical protein
MFTGPGVIEATNANAAMETIRLITHSLQFSGTSHDGKVRLNACIEQNTPHLYRDDRQSLYGSAVKRPW